MRRAPARFTGRLEKASSASTALITPTVPGRIAPGLVTSAINPKIASRKRT